MKKSICLATCLLALNLMPVFGQPTQLPQGVHTLTLDNASGAVVSDTLGKPELTKFNLDFGGGTPAELVKAIEKATGKPLNAIIPTEDADIQLPPLKMNDVVTPQLFAALQAASIKTVAVQTQNRNFGNSYSEFSSGYGFKTSDSPITDTSIWYFHAEKPSLPPVVSTGKICQFFPLETYLNRGFTVDDITTAIQTGWKMAGITSPPELNYHKETKLLIAFGEPDQLKTIDNVLQSLPSSYTTHSEMEVFKSHLEDEVRDLSLQVNKLSKKISATNSVSPEEKSGK